MARTTSALRASSHRTPATFPMQEWASTSTKPPLPRRARPSARSLSTPSTLPYRFPTITNRNYACSSMTLRAIIGDTTSLAYPAQQPSHLICSTRTAGTTAASRLNRVRPSPRFRSSCPGTRQARANSVSACTASFLASSQQTMRSQPLRGMSAAGQSRVSQPTRQILDEYARPLAT